MAPRFHTDFAFTDRESKARYVYLKYHELLSGEILDVGADERHLATHLPEGAQYLGVGRGGSPDIEIDLEAGRLPFEPDRFDCVLCLDVLEHLEHAHAVFDDLCRVSKRWVVISLPNPYRDLYAMLQGGDYAEGRHLKFYGLPSEPPEDRHRWFYGIDEAFSFVEHRAKCNDMNIVQLDVNRNSCRRWGWSGRLERLGFRLLFGRGFDPSNLWSGTLWAVLEKTPAR